MIKYTDDLSTGNDVIDRQHCELFEKINDFLFWVDSDEQPESLARIIAYLTRYVDFHFETEEHYMELIKYKRRDVHKKQHLYFINRLNGIISEVQMYGPSKRIAEQAEDLLVLWFLRHIKTEDAILGHNHHAGVEDESGLQPVS